MLGIRDSRGEREIPMAETTIAHKQKETLAHLWDALSDILEDPSVSMPQDLRDQALTAIDDAFRSADGEILDFRQIQARALDLIARVMERSVL